MESKDIKVLVDKSIHQLDNEHDRLSKCWQPYRLAVGPFVKPKRGYFSRLMRWLRQQDE